MLRARGFLVCSGAAIRPPPFSPLSATGCPPRRQPRHLVPQPLGCSSMPLAEVRPSLGFCQIQLGLERAGGRRTWGRRRHPPARSGRPPLQPGWEAGKDGDPGCGKGRGAEGSLRGSQLVSGISSRSRSLKDTFFCRINPGTHPGSRARERWHTPCRPICPGTPGTVRLAGTRRSGISRRALCVRMVIPRGIPAGSGCRYFPRRLCSQPSDNLFANEKQRRKKKNCSFFSSFLLWKQEELIIEIQTRGLFFSLSQARIIMR